MLVGRYESRLLAFCRHLLGSREDAEDVLQEVIAAAFNAMLADDRPINVRPWLYRIARNRSLNHLRRTQAIGVDSMDIHFSDHGASTADKVHEREEFRLLVGDIHELPETQRTALVLREMDALSYEQIAEAMETTVPSVKSLLVRARVSLAEAAEARLLSCDEVRIELGEIAEGLQRRPEPARPPPPADLRALLGPSGSSSRRPTRRWRRCCRSGRSMLLKKLALAHLGHSAGAGLDAPPGAAPPGRRGRAARPPAGARRLVRSRARPRAASSRPASARSPPRRRPGSRPRRSSPPARSRSITAARASRVQLTAVRRQRCAARPTLVPTAGAVDGRRGADAPARRPHAALRPGHDGHEGRRHGTTTRPRTKALETTAAKHDGTRRHRSRRPRPRRRPGAPDQTDGDDAAGPTPTSTTTTARR